MYYGIKVIATDRFALKMASLPDLQWVATDRGYETWGNTPIFPYTDINAAHKEKASRWVDWGFFSYLVEEVPAELVQTRNYLVASKIQYDTEELMRLFKEGKINPVKDAAALIANGISSESIKSCIEMRALEQEAQ